MQKAPDDEQSGRRAAGGIKQVCRVRRVTAGEVHWDQGENERAIEKGREKWKIRKRGGGKDKSRLREIGRGMERKREKVMEKERWRDYKMEGGRKICGEKWREREKISCGFTLQVRWRLQQERVLLQMRTGQLQLYLYGRI